MSAPLILATNSIKDTGYDVDNSLAFNDDDSPVLSKTASSAGNKRTWTISWWFKRSNLGTMTFFWQDGASTDHETKIAFDSSNRLFIYDFDGSSFNMLLKTNRLFRDVSAWYNAVIAVDTTDGTAANRIKMYINGVQETSFETATYPSQNHETEWNSDNELRIAKDSSGEHFDGYMTEIVNIDGSQLAQTSFAEFDEDSPTHWKPIDVSGLTFGTNGFHLDFENKGKIHTLTANGNVHHETDQAKFGNSSIYFDGNGDYIGINDIDQFTFPGDFTVEFFARMGDQADNYTTLFDDENHRFRVNLGSASTSAPKLTFYSTITDAHTSGTSDIGDNAWHHCAIVRDNGTLRIFVDGTQENTRASSGGLIDVSGAFEIGRYDESASLQYAGYLDEIRISSIARYTSNFTPTTSAFVDDEHTRLLIHSDAADGNTSFVDSSGVAGGIGNDVSGNNNDFVSTNINTIVDQSTDTCTNNFATLNPLINNGFTYKNGNLEIAGGADNHFAWGNFAGKMDSSSAGWYFEMKVDSGGTIGSSGRGMRMGIGSFDFAMSDGLGTDGGWSLSSDTGKLIQNNKPEGYQLADNGGNNLVNLGVTPSVGDIINVAWKNGKVFFGINGTYYAADGGSDGDPANGTNPSHTISSTYQSDAWIPVIAASLSNGADGCSFNFGNPPYTISSGNSDSEGFGNFEYAVPSGYFALCSKNLAEYGG